MKQHDLMILAFVGILGCSTNPSAQVPQAQVLVNAKCGACHVPPKGAERELTVLAPVLVKHRRRLSLREDQWTEVQSFLAKPAKAP